MNYPSSIKYHCDFCPKTFESGTLLNYHIGDEHPEVVNAILSALPREKENANMLPNAGTPKQRGGGGNTGSGSGGGGNTLPYLNQSHLSVEPQEAEILMVRDEPKHRFGHSVVVKLSLAGVTYLWTLNINNNPNFGILLKQFGKDEAKWSGKKILLCLEQDEFSESYNIRTHFPPKGK